MRQDQVSGGILNALREFDEWCKVKNITFGKILNGEITRAEKGIVESNDTGNIEIIKDSYMKISTITQDLEQGLKTGRDFTHEYDVEVKNKSEFLNFDKEFKALYDKRYDLGVTATERKLLEAFETYMSPQDKEKAIQPGVKIGDVVKQVNQAVNQFQIEINNILIRDKDVERSLDEDTNKQRHQEPTKMMDHLGQPFGVMDEIVKSMRQALSSLSHQNNEHSTKQNYATVAMSDVKLDKNIATQSSIENLNHGHSI